MKPGQINKQGVSTDGFLCCSCVFSASPKRRRSSPLRTCLNQAIDASPWPVAVLHLFSASEMALRVDVIGCGHLTAIRLGLWLCTIWPGPKKNGFNQLRSEPELNMVGPKLKTPNINIY